MKVLTSSRLRADATVSNSATRAACPSAWMASRVVRQHAGGVIGRAIIDDDQFDIRRLLQEHRIERPRQEMRVVAGRDDDTDQGCGRQGQTAAGVVSYRERLPLDTSGLNFCTQDLPPHSQGACRAMPEATLAFSVICTGMQALAC